MIAKFWGKNVGVLGDFEVELGPLTVLVGPNASGKTTFLRALRCLAMLMKMPAHGRVGSLRLGYRATIADLISRDHKDGSMTLGVETQQDRDNGRYEITLRVVEGRPQIEDEKARWTPSFLGAPFNFDEGVPEVSYFDLNGKKISSAFPRDSSLPLLCGYLMRNDPRRRDELRALYKLVDSFAPFHVYRFSPSEISRPARVGDELQHNGAGLAAELDDLVGRDRGAFEEITTQLVTLFPHIRQLNLATLRPGAGSSRDGEALKVIIFERRDGSTVTAEMESDGVLLSLAHLCLSTKRRDPAFAVEEPETGTYPSLLKSRIDLFREIAEGRTRTSQVLITTHSPTLLTCVGDPSCVRIFQPTDRGVIISTPSERSMMEVIGRRLNWTVDVRDSGEHRKKEGRPKAAPSTHFFPITEGFTALDVFEISQLIANLSRPSSG